MKKIFFIFFTLTLFGCKSTLISHALEKKGLYDEKAKILSFKSNEKEVVFIPMIHVGTESFYKDVKLKIDSLSNLNYFFYFELIEAELAKDTFIRKFIKLTEIPIQKDGYKPAIDSIFKANNIKLKKELISQPSYEYFGLDSNNSKNVDLSLVELVNYFEKKYYPIELEKCDYEISIYEKPKCPLKLTKEVRDDVMLTPRNNKVLNELNIDAKNKIVIIYGKGHLKGIKVGLLENGYIETNDNKL